MNFSLLIPSILCVGQRPKSGRSLIPTRWKRQTLFPLMTERLYVNGFRFFTVNMKKRKVLAIAITFGTFQGLMPLIGFLVGFFLL